MSLAATEPNEAFELPILIESTEKLRFLFVSIFGIAILTTSPAGMKAARPGLAPGTASGEITPSVELVLALQWTLAKIERQGRIHKQPST